MDVMELNAITLYFALPVHINETATWNQSLSQTYSMIKTAFIPTKKKRIFSLLDVEQNTNIFLCKQLNKWISSPKVALSNL